jgi:hypothetical protein
MLNPLGFLVFVRNLSLTNSRGFFIPNGIISFYFNDLSISGWALVSNRYKISGPVSLSVSRVATPFTPKLPANSNICQSSIFSYISGNYSQPDIFSCHRHIIAKSSLVHRRPRPIAIGLSGLHC